MKEISVRAFDDLDFHECGLRNEACVTLAVGLNGTWRELDLTEGNEKLVRNALERFMAAGSEPAETPQPVKPLAQAAARNERIRAWCRETGRRNSSGTGWAYQTNTSQADYFGLPLIREYEAYLTAQKEGKGA